MISIRRLSGKVDPLVLTLYWAGANTLFSPLMLGLRIYTQEPLTEYSTYDIKMMFMILVFTFTYMQLQTLAYVSDKAVRIAPVATFVLIINCLIDVFLLGT